MKRRNVLGLIGTGVAGTSGCLRLQGEEGSTPDGSSTPARSPTPDATPSDGTQPDDGSAGVTLTESWTGENGIDFIWTVEGIFYFNGYNYAAEASHGDGVRWSGDATHEGVDENLGADAFATDGRHMIFGHIPDPEGNEERGGHFHAYDRATGEEVWAASAPSDGKHNYTIGATVIDDIAVLAVTDYGSMSQQEPLVWGVDIETGEERWRTDQSTLPRSFISYLGSHDGEVYVGMMPGGVQVLAGDTGTMTDTHESWYIDKSWGESFGQIHGETLFAASEETLAAHPLGGNGLSWSTSGLGSVHTPPAVDNSLVVVGTEEGEVHALERGSGETRWEASITNPVGAIETTGSHVWVGDTDIGLTAYDRETGSLVHRSAKPVNGDDIAVADDVLLLGGDTATAYTID